jgi:hypothetical protein
MWFKHRAWIPVAWALSLLNLVSVGIYVGPGENLHVTIHALLAVLFGLGAQRLALRKSLTADTDVAETLRELDARLAELDGLQGVERRLPQLEERLDFIERALVEVRSRPQLPHKE